MIISPAMVAIFAAAAAFEIYLLAVSGKYNPTFLSNREAHASHIVMNSIMAIMSTRYLYDIMDHILLMLLIVIILCLLIYLSFDILKSEYTNIPSKIYHIFGLCCMIFIMWYSNSHMHDHMIHNPKIKYIFIIISMIFIVDIFATIMVSLRPWKFIPEKNQSDFSKIDIQYMRLSSIPHIVMDIGMAMMFAMH